VPVPDRRIIPLLCLTGPIIVCATRFPFLIYDREREPLPLRRRKAIVAASLAARACREKGCFVTNNLRDRLGSSLIPSVTTNADPVGP